MTERFYADTVTKYLKHIRDLKSLERFEYYIRERFSIREMRDAGFPQERWTDDPILRKYKFTNVKREWDYTSQWLINNWYRHIGDQPQGGVAAVFARFTCHVPTFEDVGRPTMNIDGWLTRALFKMTARAMRKEKVFTSAYMIVGVEGRSKSDYVLNDIIRPAYMSGLITNPWKGTAMELHDKLHQLNGFGDFMTQECILDLMQTFVLKKAPDKIEYGWAGPGAMRGLKRIADVDIKSALNRYDAREQMMVLWHALKESKNIPTALRLSLTVHDIEFSLCEFDKYERVLWGTGAPKQLFTPRPDGGFDL